MMKELTSTEEWQSFLKGSEGKTSILFKHSTQCPISAEAFEEFQSFVSENHAYEYGFVKVIESRPISNQIAEDLNVTHKSPQIFILNEKQVKWTESHWNIKKEAIAEQL